MIIELNAEQHDAVHQGQTVEIVDPLTDRAYVIIASETYRNSRTASAHSSQPSRVDEATTIPPGIRLSREALRRDLPQLLSDQKLRGQCIAYHGNQRIGIARDMDDLLGACIRQGLRDDDYYIGVIDPTELIEEEEIDPRHLVDSDIAAALRQPSRPSTI